MNEKIKNHLIKYCKSKAWPTDNDNDLIEGLKEAKEVWSGNEDEHRHWIEYDVVVEIDDMYIRYGSAKGAGDQGVYDAGWEFDPSSIIEVKPKIIEITIYEPI